MAASEIAYTINWMRIVSKLELVDETRITEQGSTVVIRHVPLGLAVDFLPWNYPLLKHIRR